MISALIIASFITSTTSMVLSFITHLKYCKCGSVDVEFTNTPVTANAPAIITPTPVSVK